MFKTEPEKIIIYTGEDRDNPYFLPGTVSIGYGTNNWYSPLGFIEKIIQSRANYLTFVYCPKRFLNALFKEPVNTLTIGGAAIDYLSFNNIRLLSQPLYDYKGDTQTIYAYIEDLND